MLCGGGLEPWFSELRIGLVLAQSLDPAGAVPPQITVVNPQILVAIVAGLLMAFAFQLLLTNLGIAIGITALGLRFFRKPEPTQPQPAAEPSEAASPRNDVRTIGLAAGSGILLTVNVVLFAACFLATKLSLVSSPFVGAILGTVIWSAYFLILTWLSSTAMTSLVGSLWGTAAAGFRAITSAIAAAFSSPAEPAIATADTIRQEVKAALGSADVQSSLKAYVERFQPPALDLDAVRQEIAALLDSPTARSLAGRGVLRQVDRQTFLTLLRDRPDLSQEQAEQIVEQLESLWQQSQLGQQAEAQPSPADVNQVLTQILQSIGLDWDAEQRQPVSPSSAEQADPGGLPQPSPTLGLLRSLRQADLGLLKQAVLNRIDWSDVDVAQVWQQLRSLQQSWSGENGATAPAFSPIQADVEAFLLTAEVWSLGNKALRAKFREILYDPEAAPDLVRQQLEAIQPEDFAAILRQRHDVSASKIDKIVDRLEQVRQNVLATAKQAEADAIAAELADQLADALPDQPTPDAIDRSWQTLAQRWQNRWSEFSDALSQFDRDRFARLLHPRQLSADLLDEWIAQLTAGRDRWVAQFQERQARVQTAIAELLQKLESYFRHTKTKQFTPEQVQRKLQSLFEEAKDALSGAALPNFDRATLEKVLKRRKGLDKAQIQAILDQVEQSWQAFVTAAQQTTEAAQPQRAIDALIRSLEKVDWAALDLPDSQQALMQQLTELGLGTWALKQLQEVDWQQLAERLSGDAPAQPLVRRVRKIVQQTIRAPRRWAVRTPVRSWNFADRLQDFAQHAERSELELGALKANLEQIAQHCERQTSQSAATALAEPIDRALLLATLTAREDISTAEAAQILDRLESARTALVEAMQQAQQQEESSFEQLLAQLRQSLTALQLPNLSPDAVRQDFYRLLDLPQAGLDLLTGSVGALLETAPLAALQQRLSQLNRDAIASLLQARSDLSETVRAALVEQIAGVRDQVMQQVEQVQAQAQQQLAALKQQAQQQAEETRKAAMIAAWWLFGTAITSLTSAAIAGVLGVTGIHPIAWSLWLQNLISIGRG